MKKLFLVLAAATLSFGAAYAQDEAPAQEQTVEQAAPAVEAEAEAVEEAAEADAE